MLLALAARRRQAAEVATRRAVAPSGSDHRERESFLRLHRRRLPPLQVRDPPSTALPHGDRVPHRGASLAHASVFVKPLSITVSTSVSIRAVSSAQGDDRRRRGRGGRVGRDRVEGDQRPLGRRRGHVEARVRAVIERARLPVEPRRPEPAQPADERDRRPRRRHRAVQRRAAQGRRAGDPRHGLRAGRLLGLRPRRPTRSGGSSRYLSRVSGTLCDGAHPRHAERASTSRSSAPSSPSTTTPARPACRRVDSDNFTGAVAATEYLLGLGPPAHRLPRRPARPRVGTPARARLPAGAAPGRHRGRPDARSSVGGYQADSAEEAARRAARAATTAPTAIFAANDVSAIDHDGGRPRRSGSPCPEDLSVIGFDNVPESALCEPPLTTIEQPIQRMGFEAVAAADRADRGDARPRRPTRCCPRGSSSAARAAAPGTARDGHPGRSASPPTATRRGRSAERVEDLLGRMTREEKVAQLGSAWVFQLADGQSLSPASARRSCSGTASGRSRASRARARSTPRGCGHARERDPATPRREDAAGDPGDRPRGDLLRPDGARGDRLPAGDRPREHVGAAARRGARATRSAVQMRAVGAHQGLAPVLDVCRDPRWGRTEETFGEDPYLVARMGVAFVQGPAGRDAPPTA